MTDQTPTPDPWTEFPAGSDGPTPDPLEAAILGLEAEAQVADAAGQDPTPYQAPADAKGGDAAPDPEFPDFSDEWTAPAAWTEIDLSGAVPAFLVATIGQTDDLGAPRVVRVFAIEDQVAVYLGSQLQFSRSAAELPRTLHQAVKLYNAELAAF